jgi:hypothetical protein
MKMIGGIMAGYCLVLGAVLTFADKDRFTSAGWSTAMQIPGAPHSWGIILGLCGAVMSYGILRRHWVLASYAAFCAGTWSMFFAVTFVISAVNYGTAGLTGIPTYLLIALIFAVLGAALKEQRT